MKSTNLIKEKALQMDLNLGKKEEIIGYITKRIEEILTNDLESLDQITIEPDPHDRTTIMVRVLYYNVGGTVQ